MNSRTLTSILSLSVIALGLFYLSLGRSNTAPWIVMDIKGVTLSKQEKWMLKQPAIAGVILTLAKSYGNPSIGGKKYPSMDTVKKLTSEIHEINRELLVFMDYEGGRIIRVEDANLPHIPLLSEKLQSTPVEERPKVSRQIGQQVGRTLKNLGVNVLLGPVLDISVSGSPLESRAISTSPDHVKLYGEYYMDGVISEGITPVLKHFPGLGYTTQDTHHEQALDIRPAANIFNSMQPFAKLLSMEPTMVMPSHAIYPEIDSEPATTSKKWHQILRKDLGFNGKIITDDTSMGALKNDNITFEEHLESIHQAGNDYVLVMHKQDMLYAYLKQNTLS